MARPQSPDYDKRRGAIIAAAANLYARAGFEGASLADLGQACGASKSLIYHYFPSKEDILYAVMSTHLEALAANAEAVLAAPGLGPRERLHDLSLRFMQLYVGAVDNHKVLLNELDSLPEVRRADVVRKQRRIIAIVEEQVRAIRPDVGALSLPLTMLFFGMINWTHTWFKAEGAVGPEALANLAVEMMLTGLEGLQAS